MSAHKVVAAVASNPSPIPAAAITWTAHPQSILATEAIEPTVFASRAAMSSHRVTPYDVTHIPRSRLVGYDNVGAITSASKSKAEDTDASTALVGGGAGDRTDYVLRQRSALRTRAQPSTCRPLG
jgi:hypothetical protein